MQRFALILSSWLLSLGLACGLAEPVRAAEPAPAHHQAEQWRMWGGEAAFRWNRSLLVDYGIEVSSIPAGRAADARDYERVEVREETTLDFASDRGGFGGFIRGSLGLSGGFELNTPRGSISLRDARFQARAADPYRLDLVDAQGKAWFYVDRLMYEIEGGRQAPVLVIKASDLRVGDALVEFLGVPQLAGLAVANVKLVSRIQIEGRDSSYFQPDATAVWPGDPVSGQPGAMYQADVFMYYFSSQIMRQGTDFFDPTGGNKIVLAPSSTLRNNRNNGVAQVTIPCSGANCPSSAPPMLPDPLGTSAALYAADIAWYQKFTGPYNPYANDQHPFLIWNLYRIGADGRIEQIGRSGVKHAWLTTNSFCDGNTGSNHILGRGCVDTYSQNNNDEVSDLGPRSEIIPSKGLWGRCGSVYDRDCDGAEDDYETPCSNLGGNTAGCRNWAFRLAVHQDEVDSTLQPGATYWLESWYVARDDVNIFNTMQTRAISFSRSGQTWSRTDGVSNDPAAGLKLGPAIDRWLARGTATATARSTDVATADGQGRLAVQVTALPGGLWRYDYVVANFDYAVAQTSGAEPNLRVLANPGFNALEVQAGGAVTLQDTAFSDGDRDPGNDWPISQVGTVIAWNAASATLDWGTMFRFSFTASTAPRVGEARLLAPDGRRLVLTTLVPTGERPPVLFADGFEG